MPDLQLKQTQQSGNRGIFCTNIEQLKAWLNQQIVGQNHLVERLIIALLADGHLLVEGAPGLAKTKAIKTLSEGMRETSSESSLPDLLPADITGSDIFRPQQATLNSSPARCFTTWYRQMN